MFINAVMEPPPAINQYFKGEVSSTLLSYSRFKLYVHIKLGSVSHS